MDKIKPNVPEKSLSEALTIIEGIRGIIRGNVDEEDDFLNGLAQLANSHKITPKEAIKRAEDYEAARQGH